MLIQKSPRGHIFQFISISVDPKITRMRIIQLILMSVNPKITKRTHISAHPNNHYEDTWFKSYRNKCILRNYYYYSEERFLTNLYKGNCPQRDLLPIQQKLQENLDLYCGSLVISYSIITRKSVSINLVTV